MDVKHLAMEKFIPKERILNAHCKLQKKKEKENKVAKNHIAMVSFIFYETKENRESNDATAATRVLEKVYTEEHCNVIEYPSINQRRKFID